MRDDIDIRIVGDEILCDGNVVCRFTAPENSLTDNFKEWLKEYSGSGQLSEYIEEIDSENYNLSVENDALKDDYNQFTTEISEAVQNAEESFYRDDDAFKEIKEVIERYEGKY